MLFPPSTITSARDFSLHEPVKETFLEVRKLDERAILPVKAHATDLGYDLFALEDIVLPRGRVTKVRTGIACHFPKGYGALIRDRSSVATKIGVFTVAGVIDQEYTGEIIIAFTCPLLENQFDFFTERRVDDPAFRAGDKIAQMILIPVITFPIMEVIAVNETTRGSNGFGSTGT